MFMVKSLPSFRVDSSLYIRNTHGRRDSWEDAIIASTPGYLVMRFLVAFGKPETHNPAVDNE